MRYITDLKELDIAIRGMEDAAQIAQQSLCLRSKCGAVIIQEFTNEPFYYKTKNDYWHRL